MRVQKCKGTRDLAPEQMRRFRFIEGVFKDTCLKWDYEEVRTPTIEYLHLFTSTGTLTPGTLSKVYSFLDWDGWSGERVVLRPDGTIPVARMYIDEMAAQKQARLRAETPAFHSLRETADRHFGVQARLFYVNNIFIFEETGKETRERWQCGAELIGLGATAADAEMVTVAIDTLRKLGLKNLELKLSHAGLIRALLAGFGLSAEEQGCVFDQILDGDVAVLSRLKDQTPDLVRVLTPLLDLKGESSGFLKNLKATFNQGAPEFAPALDNFIGIADLLTALGQPYEIDISSGRGFEYYTGVIFQISVGGVKVGGGGRYDALIPLLGGADVPACGFALYLDPLMDMVATPIAAADRILVTADSQRPAAMKTAFAAVQSLQTAGYIASLGSPTVSKAQYSWQLQVRAGAKGFTLKDRSGKTVIETKTIADVLKAIGGRGGR